MNLSKVIDKNNLARILHGWKFFYQGNANKYALKSAVKHQCKIKSKLEDKEMTVYF